MLFFDHCAKICCLAQWFISKKRAMDHCEKSRIPISQWYFRRNPLAPKDKVFFK